MKKLIFTLGLFLGLTTFGKAQAKISMELDKGICIESFTAYYDDRTQEDFGLGCEGQYSFTADHRKISGLGINGVLCGIGEETEVYIDGRKATVKVVNVSNTIVDDLNGLIR